MSRYLNEVQDTRVDHCLPFTAKLLLEAIPGDVFETNEDVHGLNIVRPHACGGLIRYTSVIGVAINSLHDRPTHNARRLQVPALVCNRKQLVLHNPDVRELHVTVHNAGKCWKEEIETLTVVGYLHEHLLCNVCTTKGSVFPAYLRFKLGDWQHDKVWTRLSPLTVQNSTASAFSNRKHAIGEAVASQGSKSWFLSGVDFFHRLSPLRQGLYPCFSGVDDDGTILAVDARGPYLQSIDGNVIHMAGIARETFHLFDRAVWPARSSPGHPPTLNQVIVGWAQQRNLQQLAIWKEPGSYQTFDWGAHVIGYKSALIVPLGHQPDDYLVLGNAQCVPLPRGLSRSPAMMWARVTQLFSLGAHNASARNKPFLFCGREKRFTLLEDLLGDSNSLVELLRLSDAKRVSALGAPATVELLVDYLDHPTGKVRPTTIVLHETQHDNQG